MAEDVSVIEGVFSNFFCCAIRPHVEVSLKAMDAEALRKFCLPVPPTDAGGENYKVRNAKGGSRKRENGWRGRSAGGCRRQHYVCGEEICDGSARDIKCFESLPHW